MNHDFWHDKWIRNNIGFHLPEVNPLLVQHLPSLNLPHKARLFLPLCGKSMDIAWLISQGYRIAGAELSTIAIQALFDHLQLKPDIQTIDNGLALYSASGIDIVVGDLFKLTPHLLGEVDAIYDRAALIAMPYEMRQSYTAQLVTITHAVPQLLISLTYDQTVAEGPPFSVTEEEIQQHYRAHYSMTKLADHYSEQGLKGSYPAREQVWRLQKL